MKEKVYNLNKNSISKISEQVYLIMSCILYNQKANIHINNII